MSTSDLIFFFAFFWALFVGARLFVFAVNIDIDIKKRVWPAIIIGLGAMLLWFAYMLHFPARYYWLLLLGVMLIVFINLRGFYFCKPCGRMIAHKDVLKKPINCERCGNKLT
ncbi:MAG: hypothetical protein ABUK11_05675 [Mariprofundaceae bacterium]